MDHIDELTRRTWLVQRVTPRAVPAISNKGLDRWFSFDYMGSSEYEFGTMGATVAAMRAAGDLIGIAPIYGEINEHTYRAFYVGRKEERDLAELLFQDQLNGHFSDRETRTLDRSEISVAYGTDREEHHAGRLTRVTGWVVHAPVSMVPWAFFKKEEDAVQWLQQLGNPDRPDEDS